MKKHGIPLANAIVSKDVLLTLPRKNGNYIINMEDDRDSKGNPLSGTHWICFRVDGDKAVYFDSFGMIPPLQIRDFLKGKKIKYNNNQIQNVYATTCGYYCIAFLFYISNMHKKIPDLFKRFQWFLNHFVEDPTKNQKILERLLEPV
jgi:hypothetical protein